MYAAPQQHNNSSIYCASTSRPPNGGMLSFGRHQSPSPVNRSYEGSFSEDRTMSEASGGGGGGQSDSERERHDKPQLQRQLLSLPAPQLPTDVYDRWSTELGRRGLMSLRRQWEEVHSYKSTDTTVAFHGNTSKCRYMDVHCLDRSRVVLKADLDDKCDFIHASHVHGIVNSRPYILTQGPIENVTVVDFWRMAWQCRVGIVVMLIQPEEHREKRKCANYWPQIVNTNVRHGSFTIQCRAVNVQRIVDDQNLVITQLVVRRFKSTRTQHVLHYQWTAWPDKNVPTDAMGGVVLVKMMNAYHRRSTRPIVVHCSAGIGRTGTLVGIAMSLQRLELGQHLDFVQILKELRDQRQHSIQTELQYLFMIRCVLDYVHFENKTAVPPVVSALMEEYDKYVESKSMPQPTGGVAGPSK